MPTFEVARGMILSSVSPLGVERVELLAALGRVIPEDLAAPWDLPLCDNSAMDGFAVRESDCRPGGALRITGYIPAGGAATPAVDPGCAPGALGHDEEAVPAEAPDGVGRADAVLEALRDLAQDPVARRVAMDVVDQRELVDVEQQRHDGSRGAAQPADRGAFRPAWAA